MSDPRYPVPTPEQVESLMSDPDLVWEEVPEEEVPPVMSEANAAELLRRLAEED
ncbi:hypothetical protein ACWDUL_33665 [Nocardia niigatensis]